MYGLVNKAVHDLIVSQFGQQTWEQIKQEAGITNEAFINMESYPDDLTYSLVGAASKVLNISPAQVLHAFGEYWVRYTAQEGYGELLNMAGDSLPEFLRKLDDLHARVGLSFPQLQPPSFEVEGETAQAMDLHYYSERQGLAPMVVGLIHGLGARFETPVQVEQTESREQGHDHDVFHIQYGEQNGQQ